MEGIVVGLDAGEAVHLSAPPGSGDRQRAVQPRDRPIHRGFRRPHPAQGRTTSSKLTGDVSLEPAKESGTGAARDPEMVALEDVIAQINDLFSGDHPDSSVRNVVTHIKDRLEESKTLQQQAQNNNLAQFSASPDLQNEFVGAVIGAMDSSAELSTQKIKNSSEISQKLLGELVPGSSSG